MSLTFESPTHRGNGTGGDAYFTPLNMPSLINTEDNNNTNNNTNTATNTPYYTAPINPSLHQDFLNAIQARQATQPTVLLTPIAEKPPMTLTMPMHRRQMTPTTTTATNTTTISGLKPIDSHGLKDLMMKYKDSNKLLVLDVRSFVQFSHCRISGAINVSIPNTILRRPTFTLDKVYEAIVLDTARERLKEWASMECIVFYDQQSQLLQENSASAYLAGKLIRAGFKGQLNYLKGGFEAFSSLYKDQCDSSATTHSKIRSAAAISKKPNLRLNNMPMATPSLGPFTAPMPHFENQAFNPFFSNIRQNMELSHGPIRERFPIRLPAQHPDPKNGPEWLRNTLGEQGAQYLAETYEKLERTEQRRLQNIMHFHSKHTDNASDFPFSIVAGIEMGALNRYTNIWPFEYTRVKIKKQQTSNYINASYVQYIENDEPISDARPDQMDLKIVKAMKECVDQVNSYPCRRYISTQGPLPATFNDFWQMVWEQNSRVLVMLTKEEEMNKIKCHRYWPSVVDTPIQYGDIKITLTKQTVAPILKLDQDAPVNEDDVVIIRELSMVNKEGVVRLATHFQYTGWMDFGVPDNPLGTLQIIGMADKAQASFTNAGPMIVHCSAGCGRSGAFCAIDTVLFRMRNNMLGQGDILLQTISRFREQRLSMVQTLRQFVFCYEAIWWSILGYGTNQDMDTAMDTSL